ncbi:archaeal preflagellin peptidase FlaK [Methanofervidicoccus abyssi]|uniref:Archaeal preflagellin peptidase FlaK n=2 Tax=Methanofervidicoccus abyssi TaxID=2082189 RepID=A0A401HPV0_9EURY|nr:archaeal preflagellin peptidase FlaK [Methanofervidicoccus abyssi]
MGFMVDLIFYNYLIGLICLVIGAIQDLRSREVEDHLWIFMSIVGVMSHLYLTVVSGDITYILRSLCGFILCFILGYIMFLFGVGGGDGKLLAGMGALVPKYTTPIHTAFGSVLNIGYIPSFPIMVFINGMFLMVFLPIIILIKNLIRGHKPKDIRHLIALSFGEKVKVKDIRGKNRLIMGKEDDIKLFPSSEEDDFSKYDDEEEIYVTPMIPFIVPVTISYIITPYIGDYIIYLILPCCRIIP